MIDLYYWPTPNGRKISIMLEECELEYHTVPVDIGRGDQFRPEFLEISPNNRMPAIVDHDTAISVFEGGAILIYLAEKSERLLPRDQQSRFETLQWLFWQMGGLGPMLGQNLHFGQYAPEKISYAIDRYVNETSRLFNVLDKRLTDRKFIAGDYSIADMASYPWVFKHPYLQLQLEEFPNLKRWFTTIERRPAVARAYEIGASINTTPTVTEESKKILFGPNHRAVAA